MSKGTCEDKQCPYWQRKDELSMLDGCVLWGNRVIVPVVGRLKVLDMLRDGHTGITKMKTIARQVVWWLSIDTNQKCETCQLSQKSPAAVPLHAWKWARKLWCRIHIDHAGPVEGKTILVIVDAL